MKERIAGFLDKFRSLRVSPQFEWGGWKEEEMARVYDLVVTSGSYELWRNFFASPGLTKRFEECLWETGRAVGLNFEFRNPFRPNEYIGKAPQLREVGLLDFENGTSIIIGLNPRFELLAQVAFKDNQALLNSAGVLRSLVHCRGVKLFGLKGKVAVKRLDEELSERTISSDKFAASAERHHLTFEIGSSKGNRTLINFLEHTKAFWEIGEKQ